MSLKLKPICSESTGVRSFCVMVESPDTKILLDAGVSLGFRHGFNPHPQEYRALKESREEIKQAASKADLITVTHYHYDHYSPAWRSVDAKWTWSSREEASAIYSGKLVCAKDYLSNINGSQRKRGYFFMKTCSEFMKELRYVDDEKVKLGDTTVSFSHPVPHGREGGELGYVLLVEVEYDEDRLLYCPDVQGPIDDQTLNYILGRKPSIVVVGGPPNYLVGYRVSEAEVSKGLSNLKRLCTSVPKVIVDHHLLRDEAGVKLLSGIKRTAKRSGGEVKTCAEEKGVRNRLLESKRRFLYEEDPPGREFQRWLKASLQVQQRTLPPL